jgi:hypothetical protein
VELIVLGGDDAGWINSGVDELPYCVRQMAGFYLARSCRRGWKTAEKEHQHVLRCLEKGVDWRKKVEAIAAASDQLQRQIQRFWKRY